MPDYLFAYGTLQPGLAPAEVAPLVACMRPVGQATVPGTLYDLGSYPGAVLEQGSGRRIAGTVFTAPDDPDFWRDLDAYEEVNPAEPDASQFRRVRHPVELASGGSLDCWVYVYNRPLEDAPIAESSAPWT